MTALANLISQGDRDKLLCRMHELNDLDRLLRERSRQQAPDPPPTLAALSTTTGKNHGQTLQALQAALRPALQSVTQPQPRQGHITHETPGHTRRD